MIRLTRFAAASLPEMARFLHDAYYRPLSRHLAGPPAPEAPPALSTSLRVQLAEAVSWRTDVLMPYVRSLGGKLAAGHNCATCTGGCDMGHIAMMAELEASHTSLAAVLIDSAAGLAAALQSFSDARALRLAALTAEMLHPEREYLIPLILQARKDIHADATASAQPAA